MDGSSSPEQGGDAQSDWKGFYIGYPMGDTVPWQNDVCVQAVYDFFHGVALGKYPWAQGLHYIGSPRARGIRIDDNRNDLCRMALEDAEQDPRAQVLVMLDRDMAWPPDGIAQLVQTCTEETPIVCGVYTQRSLDSPYPHVYRYLELGVGRWDESCRVSSKLGMEVLEKLERLGVPPAEYQAHHAVRFAQPDGTPLPERLRLLENAYGATGMVAIHLSLLRKMKQLAKQYPVWRRAADALLVRVEALIAAGELLEETREPDPHSPNEAPPRLALVPKTEDARALLAEWTAADEKARAYNCYPWFRERGEKGDMAFFNNCQGLGFRCVVDCSVWAGHYGEALIGLPQFMEVYAPTLRLQRDHARRVSIKSVCAVIPTLDPEVAGPVLNEARATAGMPLMGVIVADYHRRGGTVTLNEGMSAALRTDADAILLLDDDLSFPQHGWLRRLADAIEAPEVAAAGPTIECRGPQGKPVEDFLASGGDLKDMPFLCGAAMLYRRGALEHIGPLDEHLKHYHSDTSHAFMLRKSGWKLVWVPGVKVDHAIAASGFDAAQWDADRIQFEATWESARGAVISVAQPEPTSSSFPQPPAVEESSTSAAGVDLAAVPV